MATTVKIQLNSTDTNQNNLYTTIGYVNPNVSDGTLVEFAKKLNGLTSNSFKSVSKIETTDITSTNYYPIYVSQFYPSGIYSVNAEGSGHTTFYFTGSYDGALYPVCKKLSNTNYSNISNVEYNAQEKAFIVNYTGSSRGGIDTYELRIQKTQSSQSDADLAAPKLTFYLVVNA